MVWYVQDFCIVNYTQVKIASTIPNELYTGENPLHRTWWIIHRCKSPSPYPMNYTPVKISSTIPNELYTGENHTLWVIHWCKSSSPYPMNYLDGDNSIFVGWGLFSICFLFLFANCLPIQCRVCKMPEKFNHSTEMPLGSSWSTCLGWCWPTQGPKNHGPEFLSGSRFLGYGPKWARNGPKRKKSN